MTTDIAAAAASFRQTLTRLGVGTEGDGLDDPKAFGQRAALLAAAEVLWSRELGGLLSVKDVQILLRVGSRQAVHDLVRRGRLLGLSTSTGTVVYPRFQFGVHGRPYPELSGILAAFSAVDANPWTVASWFATAQVELDGLSPAEWLAEGRDSKRVVEVAEHSAAPLAW